MKSSTSKTTDIEQAAENAAKLIADAVNQATGAIASAALDATKLLASNAADAARVVAVRVSDDHDLLIELKTRMEGLKDDIRELKDGYAVEINDHDGRLDKMEQWKSSLEGDNGMLSCIPKNSVRLTILELAKNKQDTMMYIGIGILTLLVSLMIYHIIGK